MPHPLIPQPSACSHCLSPLKLNSVLFGQWVHLAISDTAPGQGWHLKGCHAAALLKVPPSPFVSPSHLHNSHSSRQACPTICVAVGVLPEVADCVESVHRLFHIMYIFNPSLPSHEEDMVWFQANVWQVMETLTTSSAATIGPTMCMRSLSMLPTFSVLGGSAPSAMTHRRPFSAC